MSATLANNNELRIRFTGRADKKEEDFYVAHVKIPCSIDLNNAVLLFFPDESEKGFGGDLIIRREDNKVVQKPRVNLESRTRNRTVAAEPGKEDEGKEG